MNAKEYTLDRFEGDYAVFLKRPEETEPLLIHRTQISVQVQEGNIVQVEEDGEHFQITVLKDATAKQKERVENLLKQLKIKEDK